VASVRLVPIEPTLVAAILFFGASSIAATCVAVWCADRGRIDASLAALVMVFPFDVLVSAGTVAAVTVGAPSTWIPRRRWPG
jgi:hypothetical protein